MLTRMRVCSLRRGRGASSDGVPGRSTIRGSYWSATEGRHVIYESRLELDRLLFADFDRSVHRICAQPFLLAMRSNDVKHKHIPDFLLITDRGPTVVDVKPAHRLSKPEVVSTFAWTRAALERRGWMYEVWSEPNEVELPRTARTCRSCGSPDSTGIPHRRRPAGRCRNRPLPACCAVTGRSPALEPARGSSGSRCRSGVRRGWRRQVRQPTPVAARPPDPNSIGAHSVRLSGRRPGRDIDGCG